MSVCSPTSCSGPFITSASGIRLDILYVKSISLKKDGKARKPRPTVPVISALLSIPILTHSLTIDAT